MYLICFIIKGYRNAMAAVYDLIDAIENPKWEPKIYIPSFEWYNDVEGKPIINYGWPFLDTSILTLCPC